MGSSEMIVLDTHILIWLVDSPEKLVRKAAKKIEAAKNERELLISSISVWEISLLVKRDRLKLTTDLDTWLGLIYKLRYFKFVPVDKKIAQRSVFLPEPLHKDLADRIIIATTLRHGAELITSDKKILTYPHVRTVWG